MLKKDTKIVARKNEQKILQEILLSPRSEFVAIYGRRRVGKTYLIKTFFRQKQKECIFFHTTGIYNEPLLTQIKRFVVEIGNVFYNKLELSNKENWEEAFELLTKALESIPKKKKIVLFLDELPWMATKRSRLIQVLDYYWNRYWVDNKRLKLIICGSSASWIIKNIINNKGGLHNRITKLIELKPFDLNGVKEFLNYTGVKLKEDHILQLYMSIGGIPHYLEQVKRGLSAAQNIDLLCFRKDGILFKEFNNLFSSLFDESEVYLDLIRIIAKQHYGIGQADLLKKFGKRARGGSMVDKLKDLENAGFIISFIPYNHKQKGIYYRIFDEYTLFYLYWIKPQTKTIQKLEDRINYWNTKINTASWKTWSGYAFESVCYKHISNIRKALNINVEAKAGNWNFNPRKERNKKGTQIDLLFDRSDAAITICEIKYTNQPFVVDKQYAKELINKVDTLKQVSKTTKQIFIAMISVTGIKPTMYSEELISNVVTLDALFKAN